MSLPTDLRSHIVGDSAPDDLATAGDLSVGGSLDTPHSRLGFRIAPHDAMDAAATTCAISVMPDQIGVARDLLAHPIQHSASEHSQGSLH